MINVTFKCRPLYGICLAVVVFSSACRGDCIDDAAQYHRVNSSLLRAIGWHESKLNPQSVGFNKDGTRDLGAFQTNTSHLRKLAAHGITEGHLFDGCVSAYVGGWLLADCAKRLGNTWAAVGCYHSPTPARAAWYANEIAAVLRKWKAIPDGPPPYIGVPLLAPRDSGPRQAKPGRNPSADGSAAVFDASESDGG